MAALKALEACVPPPPVTWKNCSSENSHASSVCATNTISTFSEEWKQGRFADYKWDRKVIVEVGTLDELSALHGTPKYCKIDVEGFEDRVLTGFFAEAPQALWPRAVVIDVGINRVPGGKLCGDADFDAQFWQQVHDVFGPAVDFRVALLAPVALDLGDGHSVHADAHERVAYLVELERFDDGDDELHWCPSRRMDRPGQVV